MKYLFYSYYISSFFKGKYRAFQIIFSSLLLVIPLINYRGIINVLLGRTITMNDVLYVLLMIYILMNAVYSYFYQYETTSNPSSSATDATPISNTANVIITNKSYIKPSPKSQPQKLSSNSLEPPKETPEKQKVAIPVPVPVSKKEETENIEIIETPLPESDTALYEKIRKTKFFQP